MADVVSRYTTAGDIINRTLNAVGLNQVDDPFNSSDDTVIQIIGLFNNAGQDLIYEHAWQRLKRNWSITTDSATYPDGKYALPADFAYLVNNTGWDQTNDWPLNGPMTDAQFTHLVGRDLSANTIYIDYQINQNELWLFPQPPDDAITLAFRYVSRFWIDQSGNGTDFADVMTGSDDIVLYDQMMMIHRLKYEFLAAKGFPFQKAERDWNRSFGRVTGRDTGAQNLNLSRRGGGIHFLDMANVPDRGYGA